MKTANFFSVLSLVLIFAAATSAYAGNVNQKTEGPAGSLIRYHVNVILATEAPLCNTWMVKIVDGQGRQVAPPKPYVSGVTQYEFFERGPASGTRIALLVKYQFGDHFVCATELFTTPAVLTGSFLNGQTYRFDLFPTTQAPKE
jgi:hypothetical protein